jgi:glc operon protein GlcG
MQLYYLMTKDSPMRMRPSLTATDAHIMLGACTALARQNGWNVSIAIVDDSGALLLFERLDGAKAATGAIALGKAQSSAALGSPSRNAAKLLPEMPGLLKVPVGIPLIGAVPVLHQGECVGAIGVSGARPDDDESIAAAGVAAFNQSVD